MTDESAEVTSTRCCHSYRNSTDPGGTAADGSEADDDSDADGLTDGDEVGTHSTDPLDPDSDGDGLPDGVESNSGTFVDADDIMGLIDGLVADLGRSDNTINSAPKQTVDAIWTWTGAKLG